MGRMYYANAKPTDARLIHILSTPEGTVVLAMRPPHPGERGYAIGVDFTVRNAVREMFEDWCPSDDGPGWVQDDKICARPLTSDDQEQTYDVTILAAYALSTEARELLAMARENAADDRGTCKTDHQAEDCDECGTKCDDRCGVCGQSTDDDGGCGSCVNCRTPLCIHNLSDDAFAPFAGVYDTPCDRWKVTADGRFDADATHKPGASS